MPSLGELADTVSKVPEAINEGLEALSDNASEEEIPSEVVPESESELRSASRSKLEQEDVADDIEETTGTALSRSNRKPLRRA